MSVLVADPDPAMLDILSYILRRDGFAVMTAGDGLKALAIWQAQDPELVLLELELPVLDGWEVCRRIRATASTSIIVLSAVNDEGATVRALDLGADVFLSKPFRPLQLLAQTRAVLRRPRESLAAFSAEQHVFAAGDLILNPTLGTILRWKPEGDTIALTPTEFRLFATLVRHEDEVLTARALTNHIWGYTEVDGFHPLRVHVARLRRKLNDAPSFTAYIHTVVGRGYSFRRSPP
jgi:DNA-binding response OmpR family regulator